MSVYWWKQYRHQCKKDDISSGGSKGGREGRTPPLCVQILSISCSFWENLAKLRVHAPPLEGSRPPPWGNPGSVTDLLSLVWCIL